MAKNADFFVIDADFRDFDPLGRLFWLKIAISYLIADQVGECRDGLRRDGGADVKLFGGPSLIGLSTIRRRDDPCTKNMQSIYREVFPLKYCTQTPSSIGDHAYRIFTASKIKGYWPV